MMGDTHICPLKLFCILNYIRKLTLFSNTVTLVSGETQSLALAQSAIKGKNLAKLILTLKHDVGSIILWQCFYNSRLWKIGQGCRQEGWSQIEGNPRIKTCCGLQCPPTNRAMTLKVVWQKHQQEELAKTSASRCVKLIRMYSRSSCNCSHIWLYQVLISGGVNTYAIHKYLMFCSILPFLQ